MKRYWKELSNSAQNSKVAHTKLKRSFTLTSKLLEFFH